MGKKNSRYAVKKQPIRFKNNERLYRAKPTANTTIWIKYLIPYLIQPFLVRPCSSKSFGFRYDVFSKIWMPTMNYRG